MADTKDRRTVKGYKFNSFEHKKINNGINLKEATYFTSNELEKNQDFGGKNLLTVPNGERLAFADDIDQGEDFCDFGSPEHECIAERVVVEGKKNDEDEIDYVDAKNRDSSEKNPLTLPNGVRLTFGDVIALAGDYYGVTDAPIANPLLNLDQVDSGARERFKDAYSTLALTPYEGKYKERLDTLLEMLAEDSKNTGRPGQCHHNDKEWDEATGGAWLAGLPIIGGYMIKLAENNYDHFLPHAKTAYVVGHEYAIEKAREAGRSSEKERGKLLYVAYSIDAFACHFLTDAFSSGHTRTPRVELAMNVTPSNVGHLLCKYMHDEDNKFGLRVTNIRGDKWIAYGDGMLMQECSKENFGLVVEAVQFSVNQVHQAYTDPNMKLDSCVVTDLIPFVDREEKNNTPLFEVKGDGKIHRRSDINDLQDTKTITNWWGSTTALKLQWHKPQNSYIVDIS